jgi:hypothetical protein
MDAAPEFSSFPHGSCGSAAIVLNAMIEEELGVSATYVAGVRSVDERSHAWLEFDGLIVDVTADQFSEVKEPVLVTRDRSWHDQFQHQVNRHPATLSQDDLSTQSRFRSILAKRRPQWQRAPTG